MNKLLANISNVNDLILQGKALEAFEKHYISDFENDSKLHFHFKGQLEKLDLI